MKFIDNTDPKDPNKLSKCAECGYLGSIMRESPDGRRWCAIHGGGLGNSAEWPEVGASQAEPCPLCRQIGPHARGCAFQGDEAEAPTPTLRSTCIHCNQAIENADGLWVSPVKNGSTTYCDVSRSLHKPVGAEVPKPDLANDDFLIAHDDDAEVGLAAAPSVTDEQPSLDDFKMARQWMWTVTCICGKKKLMGHGFCDKCFSNLEPQLKSRIYRMYSRSFVSAYTKELRRHMLTHKEE